MSLMERKTAPAPRVWPVPHHLDQNALGWVRLEFGMKPYGANRGCYGDDLLRFYSRLGFYLKVEITSSSREWAVREFCQFSGCICLFLQPRQCDSFSWNIVGTSVSLNTSDGNVTTLPHCLFFRTGSFELKSVGTRMLSVPLLTVNYWLLWV